MSDLSDLIRSHIRALNEEAQKMSDEDGDPDRLLQAYPFFEEVRKVHLRSSVAKIHRIYRRTVGGSPFASCEEAYEKTKNEALNSLSSVMFEALADGIQFGQENSFPYKKYKVLGKLGMAVESKGWRDETSWIALSYSEDEECASMMRHFMEHLFSGMSEVTGFSKDVHDPSKIWDVYLMAVTSGVITAHTVGRRIGAANKEADVLAGIAAATKENADGE